MTPIAHIRTAFPTKFGVPRQAGLSTGEAYIEFLPEYRYAEAVRGLEEFDYVWLLWHFDQVPKGKWSPTVRPPRLGGNRRMGVFATRSPFRPNPIGLSCVRLLRIEEGTVLVVEGADMVDGTPIFDIKPYLPYADAHPDARAGFASIAPTATLQVDDPQGWLRLLPLQQREALCQCLALDPRPHYHDDPSRTYAFRFAEWDVHFQINDSTLTITELIPCR